MNFTIDTTTNVLNYTAGMALAGKVFSDIGLDLPHHSLISPQEKQTIKSMAGLIVQGRSSYAEVDLFRNDPLFQQALEFETVYAPETIRIYLDRLAGRFTPNVLSALETVNMNLLLRVQMTPIKTELSQYLPVDIDVSPMDNSGTHKEGVGRTYKGCDGYARNDNKLTPKENSAFFQTNTRHIFQIFHFFLDYSETNLRLPIRGSMDAATVKGLLDFFIKRSDVI